MTQGEVALPLSHHGGTLAEGQGESEAREAQEKNMTKIKMLVLAACVGLATQVFARESDPIDLPIYNVEKMCAERTRGNPYGENYCLREEQRDYNYAKVFWDNLSNDSKKNCLQIMESRNFAWRGYGLLSSCAMEYKQLEEVKQRPQPFRY